MTHCNHQTADMPRGNLSRYCSYIILFFLLFISGCSSGSIKSSNPNGNEPSLQQWLNTGLSPYLTRQLATHPRFRGQPLLLVGLSGADVSPSIDALTASLRDDLENRLVQTPGVRLAWRPTAAPPGHHRSLSTADCGLDRTIAYYIGIEAKARPDGRLSISVRALDVADGAWVPGFGLSWQGTATATELRQLSTRDPDPYLRGLRPLPFGAGQADLAAQYLARNLSCLLRARGHEDLQLRIEAPVNQAAFARRTLDLVGNYLSRYNEVMVTAGAGDTGLVLNGRLYQVDDDLYQLWIRVLSEDSGQRLAGVDTAAYVRLSGTRPSPSYDSRTAAQSPLLQQVRAISTGNSNQCGNGAGTLHSGGTAGSGQAQPSAACLVIELAWRSDANAYLLAVDYQGHLSRLWPARCNRDGRTVTTAATQTLQQPVSAAGTTFYALAVAEHATTAALRGHLALLQPYCSGARSVATGAGAAQWLSEFQELLDENGSGVEWRRLARRHRGAST